MLCNMSQKLKVEWFSEARWLKNILGGALEKHTALVKHPSSKHLFHVAQNDLWLQLQGIKSHVLVSTVAWVDVYMHTSKHTHMIFEK